MDKDGVQFFTRNKRIRNFIKQDHFQGKELAVNLRVKTPSKFYRVSCSIVCHNNPNYEI